RVQGSPHRHAAARIFPRPGIARLRVGDRRVPPAVLHQHQLELGPGATVPLARSQRGDQHPLGQPQRDGGARAGPRITDLGRAHRSPQARHLGGGKRLDEPGQRPRAAGPLGPRPGARADDARAGGPRGRPRPYARWAARSVRPLRPAAGVTTPPCDGPELVTRQLAFGWSFEDLRYVAEPMATAGQDTVWSMGDDTPIPPLSRIPQSLYAYLRQRFAQVTNPAIDPLRETLVMSLRMHLGRRGSLLADSPAALRLVRTEHPILLEDEIVALRNLAGDQGVTLPALWRPASGPDPLRSALDGLCTAAERAVRLGARILIVSDRDADAEHPPLPMLLAIGAVHQHLLRQGLRTRLGLAAEAGDAWDVHHFAALIGYGAEAVHPWLALASVRARLTPQARTGFRAAAEKGLLKILSKMGISTLSSYCGAQIFEALGLGAEVIDRCFTGTVSTIGGIGFAEIAEDVLARHRAAYPETEAPGVLPDHGRVRYRRDGEDHGWSPPARTGWALARTRARAAKSPIPPPRSRTATARITASSRSRRGGSGSRRTT